MLHYGAGLFGHRHLRKGKQSFMLLLSGYKSRRESVRHNSSDVDQISGVVTQVIGTSISFCTLLQASEQEKRNDQHRTWLVNQHRHSPVLTCQASEKIWKLKAAGREAPAITQDDKRRRSAGSNETSSPRCQRVRSVPNFETARGIISTRKTFC